MSSRVPTALSFQGDCRVLRRLRLPQVLRRAGLDHLAADDATAGLSRRRHEDQGIERSRERGFLCRNRAEHRFAVQEANRPSWRDRAGRGVVRCRHDERQRAPSLDELIDDVRATCSTRCRRGYRRNCARRSCFVGIEGLAGVELAAHVDVPVGGVVQASSRREVFDQIVLRVRSQRAFKARHERRDA